MELFNSICKALRGGRRNSEERAPLYLGLTGLVDVVLVGWQFSGFNL